MFFTSQMVKWKCAGICKNFIQHLQINVHQLTQRRNVGVRSIYTADKKEI